MDPQSRDLCLMLLEYYAKHLSQPRRDLFKKANSLMITPSDQSVGFLTTLEAQSAMKEARQRDLIHHHALSVSTSYQSGGTAPLLEWNPHTALR